MKIVHLIYSFNTGGAETMLVDIANEQVKQAEVSIVIINKVYNMALVEKIDKRVNVYFINRKESSKNPFPIIKLNLLLLKMNADILHCHDHNIAPLILSHLKKSIVLTLHCMGIPSKYLNQYNELFSISNSVKKDITNRTHINSKVIYNGILTRNISSKVDWAKKMMFRIICVGRLSHLIKGQHLAIEALRILKEKSITNIQLDLIGAGESEAYLKELTNKYELNNQVTFLGLKNRDYIYTHLKDYNLLIQPSLYEGFGLTVAEGMAAMIPVLVSDIDGPMEIIKNGKFGFYFKSGDAEDLAENLKLFLLEDNTETIMLKIKAAFKHVKNNFEITQTSKNYLEYYKKVK